MRLLLYYIRFAMASIGWEVEIRLDGALLVTDLHGSRWKIVVTPCE